MCYLYGWLNMIERNSLFNKVIRTIRKKFFWCLYSRKFAYLSRNSTIIKPDYIDGAKNISINENVLIANRAWLKAFDDGQITIEKNCYLGRNIHLIALGNILIEESVLIADNVYISDNIHEYKDVDKPIIEQDIVRKGEVKISRGAWIGENVCIIGAHIGENSIVSANSVVLNHVPDYTVVAGNPAKIIKTYCTSTKQWLKYNEKNPSDQH